MEWNDFLNPRSMLTPGVAGSLVMVIANTLWVEFMLPQKWSALVLSFLLIIPILARFSAKFYENVIYFLFNGLIIFALSVNTNFAGGKIQEISNSYNQNLLSQQSSISSNTNLAVDKKTNMIQLALNDPSNSTPSALEKQPKEKNKKEKQNSEPRRKFFNNWF